MSSLLNQRTVMTADVTVFTAPTNCDVSIGSTSGTVTAQIKFPSGDTFFNSSTTIASGTVAFIASRIQQGTEIKVTGGNAILHAWSE